MMKKIITLVITMTLVLSLFTGCGKDEPSKSVEPVKENKVVENTEKEEETELGFPIVEEPITLTMMVGKGPTHSNFSDMAMFQEYEKMTGIHVEWIEVPKNALKEKVNITLASNDLPDAFFKCRLEEEEIYRYGREGVFVKLNDMLDKYAPNYKKILDEYEDVRKGITMPDGGIYSLPQVVDVNGVLANSKLFLNSNWLDQVGMSAPTTTDELYEVLKAFKKLDVNGNNEADEIPLSTSKFGPIGNFLRGSWGLGTTGAANNYVDLDESTNELRFYAADEKYKDFLQYVNKLYSEGLIDSEVFTNKWPTLAAKGDEGLVGSFIGINHGLIGEKYKEEFVPVPVALKGPHGDQLYSAVNSRLKFHGSMVITTANEYPEETLRWIDHFYSDEGAILYFMGIEDVTYQVTEDGKYEYLDEILNDESGVGKALGRYVPWGGTGDASIQKDKYFKGAATQGASLDAVNNLLPYFPKEVWAPFAFTEEESEEIISIKSDIIKYVKEMEVQFAIGAKSFDKWDEYIDTLNKMGLEQYMEIYKAAYERYQH